MRRRAFLLVAAASVVLGLPVALLAAASPEEGKALFEQQCVSCHTLGGGDRVGPDLKGITARRDRAFLEAFIATPDKVLASGDPVAKSLLEQYKVPMPNLGLSPAEVDALIAYLETTAAAGEKPAEAAPSPAPAGDAARGKSLFTGSERFEADGAPCLSCHSIAGIGRLGGGKVGPDLTRTYAKLGGAEGVASILRTLAFPTMQPIYRDRALTASEQADLLAFLEQASRAERPGSSLWILVLIAVGGAAALYALTFLVWRKRALAVRRSLVAKPPPEA